MSHNNPVPTQGRGSFSRFARVPKPVLPCGCSHPKQDALDFEESKVWFAYSRTPMLYVPIKIKTKKPLPE